MPVFKIKCIDEKANSIRWLTYDTDSPSLCDESGKSLVQPTNKEKRKCTNYSPEDIIKKAHNVRTLRIVLGSKCNFNCAYCSQAYNHPEKDQTTLKDCDEFLARSDEWLDASNLHQIQFWGGEPLVYIKYLEKLIPVLREKLPNVDFYLLTNGSLLTRKIVDFLLKYRCSFSISHDAYGQKTRGEDPFENQEVLDAFLYALKNPPKCQYTNGMVGIATTFNKHVKNPLKAHRWLKDKFGGEDFAHFGEVLFITGNATVNDVIPNEKDLEEISQNFCNATAAGQFNSVQEVDEIGRKFWESLLNEENIDNCPQKCGQDRDDVLCVDLKGRVYKCQNYLKPFDVMGSVYDWDNIKIKGLTSFANREICRQCPFALACRAICPYLNGNAYADTCATRFAVIKGVIPVMIYAGTGLYPIEMHGDFDLPCHELVETKHGGRKHLSKIEFPFPQKEEIEKYV